MHDIAYYYKETLVVQTLLSMTSVSCSFCRNHIQSKQKKLSGNNPISKGAITKLGRTYPRKHPVPISSKQFSQSWISP